MQKSKLKGRKRDYGKRWEDEESKQYVPVLNSIPGVRERLDILREQIRREHRTRQPNEG